MPPGPPPPPHARSCAGDGGSPQPGHPQPRPGLLGLWGGHTHRLGLCAKPAASEE